MREAWAGRPDYPSRSGGYHQIVGPGSGTGLSIWLNDQNKLWLGVPTILQTIPWHGRGLA